MPTESGIPIPLPVDVLTAPIDWLNLVVAVLGVIATVAIALLTLRATNRADRAQVSAMEAQAEALNANAKATQAQIQILEEVVKRTNSSATTMPDVTTRISRVSWVVERIGKNGWGLRNTGTAHAYNVTVDTESDADRFSVEFPYGTNIDSVQPGGLVPFFLVRTLGSPPAIIIIILWSEEGMEVEQTMRFVISF